MPVTTNLAAALSAIKQRWQATFPGRNPSECRLWADALCIDQSNIKEKNSQVSLMADIYSSAEVIFDWLGGNEAMSLAINTVNILHDGLHSLIESLGLRELKPSGAEISIDSISLFGESSIEPKHLEWTVGYDECRWQEPDEHIRPQIIGSEATGRIEIIDVAAIASSQHWSAVKCFLDDLFWDQVWIFQECILPQTLMIVSRNEQIDFEKLSTLSSLVVEIRRKSRLFPPVFPRPNGLSKATWSGITGSGTFWTNIIWLSVCRLWFQDLETKESKANTITPGISHAYEESKSIKSKRLGLWGSRPQ
jgi:Heterokaryon incompatibility protein (HET)